MEAGREVGVMGPEQVGGIQRDQHVAGDWSKLAFHFDLNWVHCNSTAAPTAWHWPHKWRGRSPKKLPSGHPPTPWESQSHLQFWMAGSVFGGSHGSPRFNNFLEWLAELRNFYDFNFCFIIKTKNQYLTVSTCQDHYFFVRTFLIIKKIVFFSMYLWW